MKLKREVTCPVHKLPKKAVVVARRMKGDNAFHLFQRAIDRGEYVYDVQRSRFVRVEKDARRPVARDAEIELVSQDEARAILDARDARDAERERARRESDRMIEVYES